MLKITSDGLAGAGPAAHQAPAPNQARGSRSMPLWRGVPAPENLHPPKDWLVFCDLHSEKKDQIH